MAQAEGEYSVYVQQVPAGLNAVSEGNLHHTIRWE